MEKDEIIRELQIKLKLAESKLDGYEHILKLECPNTRIYGMVNGNLQRLWPRPMAPARAAKICAKSSPIPDKSLSPPVPKSANIPAAASSSPLMMPLSAPMSMPKTMAKPAEQ